MINVTGGFVTGITDSANRQMHDAFADKREEVNQKMATKKVTPKAPQAKDSKGRKQAATRVTKATKAIKSVKAVKNVKNTMNLQ